MNKIFYALFIVFIVSCQSKEEIVSPHSETNAVYFWKTVCDLDSAEYKFLKDNDVKRAYIRFFDVVPDNSPMAVEEIIPNATLQIKNSIPVDEIVPTIYITQDALNRMKGKCDTWANKILTRVDAMCSYNRLPKPTEIQLDCDWTESSRNVFFDLCKEVKEMFCRRDSTFLVSATIRLHQLSQEAPPVDYGVLMLYNIGSFRSVSETNSIISKESIEPYLKNLSAYPLHLDIAYPTYSWQLLFRNNKFVGLIRNELPDNSDDLCMIDKTHIKVLNDMRIGNLNIKKDDIIRIETSDFNTIKSVKDMVEKSLGETSHSNVIYHLDSINLSNYTEDEIKAIYR